MEFLIINENKLKITLTPEEMTEYNIDPNDSDYENPKTRRAFWRILDVARERCGFKMSGDKLLIQFYPAAAGGEIFVTKLGKIASGAERTISKSGNVAMLSSRHAIYRFSDFSSLLTVARALSDEAKERQSKLYFSEDGNYYLFMEERNTSGFFSELTILGEFASEVPGNLEPYITEHSEAVAEQNALLLLSEL